MIPWFFVLTIVFAPGNEQQMRFEFATEIACKMAARNLSEQTLIGMKGLPPSQLDYGISLCSNEKREPTK